MNPASWARDQWNADGGALWRRVGIVCLVPACLVVALAPALPLPPAEGARLMDVSLLCILYAIVALGLNVVTGYTGLLDLGIVAFAAVGAYTATILYDRPWMQFPGSLFVVLLVGGLHASVWGVLRGAPTLRLIGDYYAIVTFAFAEIARIFIRNEAWLTGGGNGYKNFPVPNLLGGHLEGGEYTGILKTSGYWSYPNGTLWHGGTWQFYYLCLGFLLLAVGVMWRLERSRVGRAWFAIKADETSAMTSGIHLSSLKMHAFAVSAFFAGVGGALLAFRTSTVSTNVFDFWFSVVVLCALVLGGMGSIGGAVGGTFIVVGLGELLREEIHMGGIVLKVDDRARFLFFGVLLVIVMVFKPQGLFPRRVTTKREPLDTTDATLFQLGDD